MNTSPFWARGLHGQWCVAVERGEVLTMCRSIQDSDELRSVCEGISVKLLDDAAATHGYHVIELSTGKPDVSIDSLSALIMQCVPIGRSYLQTETRWSSDTARLLVPRYRDIPRWVYVGGNVLRMLAVLGLSYVIWQTRSL